MFIDHRQLIYLLSVLIYQLVEQVICNVLLYDWILLLESFKAPAAKLNDEVSELAEENAMDLENEIKFRAKRQILRTIYHFCVAKFPQIFLDL